MGSSGSNLSWANSEQLGQIYNQIMPMIYKASWSAQNNQPLSTNMSGYMPSSGWFNNLSPQVTSGLWEPYNQAAREMINTMSGSGLVSGRGGYSGAAQTALGKFYSEAGKGIGTQAWNMISPIQMAGYTNPWNVGSQYSGVGQSLTPSPVISQNTQSPWATYAPMAGMMLGNSLLNNLPWGDIGSGIGSLFG